MILPDELHEAQFYSCSRDKGKVICRLCAHNCPIAPGGTGRCGVRKNIDGKLYSLVYGELVAEHVDPIEKKPLFHFLPGSMSLSISTMGCNFICTHCQNSSISQVQHLSSRDLEGRKAGPEEVVAMAARRSCRSISYTYVEPTVFYEFAYDCAVDARRKNIKNIFVSNGYMGEEAALHIAPYLDAINIDVKSFSDDFYTKICGARLQPVLDCVRLFKKLGVWVEVTTLIIPGLNDSDEEVAKIASFLAELDRAIPWHISAFYPTYKMTDRQPTSPAALVRAGELGREAGLQFVYEGNAPGGGGENTYCPGCGKTVIERYGFSVVRNDLVQGQCPHCKDSLPGVWA
ncbi:MAG: AmmeMemoRadiSam system radical SAM enzyme [Desulfopila sp.]